MAVKNGRLVPSPELVEKLIQEERWVDARRVIEELLNKDHEDHWLLARLSTTYYEMGDYEKALELADKALQIAPDCPLALWDRAGALDMLCREREALDVYENLLSRGLESIAEEECGEGEEWAAGLMADCVFRIATIAQDIGDKERAVRIYHNFLGMLDSGAQGIYSLEEAIERIRALTPKAKRLDKLRKRLKTETSQTLETVRELSTA